MDAIQISSELGRLGATFSAGSDLDTTGATLSSLKRNLPASLAIFSELVLHPTYPEADVEKLRNLQLAAIHRESLSPNGMALRVFPRLLYGAGNAYGLPFTGSGYQKSVTALTSADLRRFHDTWFKPNNATLIVVGDTTLAEIRPQLERLFGAWQPGPLPAKELKPVSVPIHPAVYLMDRPGSDQSVIIAGNVAPPYAAPDDLALESLNTLLGGDFTARINMNLREGKHWAYGAYSFLLPARGQRPFIAFAPVQTDKTAPAMLELQKELQDILGKRPPTEEELTRAKGIETRSLPGDWETNDGVAEAISSRVSYDLPADYWDSYAGKVNALSLDQLKAAAPELVHPQQLIWVVVGDLAKIEPDIRKLNLGEIHYIDADGNPAPHP
jgi:zinc protease